MPIDCELTVLCAVADVDDDTPVRALAGEIAVAVFRVGGRHYVTQDACTHGPGSLAEGFIDGEEVECPFHQGRFHIPTGRPSAPPCTIPLRVWDAQVIDGQVCINPQVERGDGPSEGDRDASPGTE
jgi:nitrite reductase/ring-hydroxylating ferredoxin subunit